MAPLFLYISISLRFANLSDHFSSILHGYFFIVFFFSIVFLLFFWNVLHALHIIRLKLSHFPIKKTDQFDDTDSPHSSLSYSSDEESNPPDDAVEASEQGVVKKRISETQWSFHLLLLLS